MDLESAGLLLPPFPYAASGLGLYPPPIITDPNGSYTGVPDDLGEKPIQDADDL